MSEPNHSPEPYGPSRLQSLVGGAVASVVYALTAARARYRSALSYVAHRVACCAACHDRFADVLRHPLTTVAVILIGLSINTAISIHAGHRDASRSAELANQINARNLRARAQLFALRQWSDDAAKQNNDLIRLMAADHPTITLPPPLPPEPDYAFDVTDTSAAVTVSTTRP